MRTRFDIAVLRAAASASDARPHRPRHTMPQVDLHEACACRTAVFFADVHYAVSCVSMRVLLVSRKDEMVGFVEVSETSGSKYGMGSGVPIADTRPVVSNLAVDTQARRSGIGTALMEACEDLVKTWKFEEIILQVRASCCVRRVGGAPGCGERRGREEHARIRSSIAR